MAIRRRSSSLEHDGGESDEQAVPLMHLEDNPNATKTDYYKPSKAFEGAHRYDPDFKWPAALEKSVVRKLDWRILLWVCIMFFALQLDRGNIFQANSDNMLDDLGINTNDYDTGQSIFFIAFVCAELPSQIVNKWIGADKWIPLQMMFWSTSAACQAFMTGKKSFYFFRALLGIWEGGFIPSTVLFLSYFYTSKELPVRLSLFWAAFELTFIVSAFLAGAILGLRGVAGLAGWRWLFALEGAATCIIGIISYFYLPPSPTQTASRFRGKDGWFTEEEEKIMVNRILRDDPTKGDMHNREPFTMKMLWDSLLDYDLWLVYLIGLTWLIPPYPLASYFTLLLRGDGFSTLTTNILTIPSYLINIITLVLWTRLSEKLNERFLLCSVSQLWCLPFLLMLRFLPDDADRWVRFALVTLIVGGFPFMHAVLVAITSTNAGSVRTRTVASAIYNMTVQLGNVIGANIYREDDKPMYRRGNSILIYICLYNLVLFVTAKVYYMWKNKRRTLIWDNMTDSEKDVYLRTTKDKGNQRLDFRFVH